MAKKNAVVAKDNPYAGIDTRLAILEAMTADVGALVAKARIKQFRTYCPGDMEVVEDIQCLTPRTLIPA